MILIVTETEWWDRVAMAVDLLLRRGSAKPVTAGDATAYIFQDVRDPEILRRLNQMPDETPLDLLVQPIAVYCPEMRSLVSVNDPSTPLEEHLKKLEGA